MNAAGRKPISTTPMEKPVVDTSASVALPQLAEITQAYSEERDLVNQLLGQAQMAGAFEEFSRTVRISKLAFVKENKLYRTLAGKKSPHGAEILSGTWEEFCQLLGRSVDQADRDISNLRSFGEEALESMSRMGIGYRELSQYRKLPDDQKTALIEVAKTGDKESFVDLAEEIIARHAKAKEESDKKVADLEADLAAKQSRLERDATRINSLEDENARLTSIPKTPAMIEEEQIAAVMAQSQLVVREVEAGLRGQLAKLERLFEDGVLPNHVRLAQQQAITQILQAARVLAGDFGITLKVEDQAPQQLLWLQNAEKLFGDGAAPAGDDDGILLPPDGE